MTPKLIKTDSDYEAALARIDTLMGAEPATPEMDELELLVHLVETYESQAYPIPLPDPVDSILFRMDQQSLAPKDLVPILGSKSKVSEILNRKRPLSLAMIRKLHSEFGIPLEVLVQEGSSAPRAAFDSLDWEEFPLAEMVKRRWFGDAITTSRELRDRAEEILGPFLTAGGIPQLREDARLRQNGPAGRVASDKALWAWEARVWHLAQEQRAEAFRPKAITAGLVSDVARLSVLDEGPKIAREILAKAGIRMVIERSLPKTHLDGVAMRCDDSSVIVGMTLRHDRLDNFWFTLCHELAHIVLHLKDPGCHIFVDDLDQESNRSREEVEADGLAQDAIVPADQWRPFREQSRIGRFDIISFARAQRVHPAIIAGRLRRETSDYRLFSDLLGHGRVRSVFT